MVLQYKEWNAVEKELELKPKSIIPVSMVSP